MLAPPSGFLTEFFKGQSAPLKTSERNEIYASSDPKPLAGLYLYAGYTLGNPAPQDPHAGQLKAPWTTLQMAKPEGLCPPWTSPYVGHRTPSGWLKVG